MNNIASSGWIHARKNRVEAVCGGSYDGDHCNTWSIVMFRISGVSPESFISLYGLSDEELVKRRARRVIVTGPGYPERIELREASVGESLLLVNFEHQPADTPYRASHAIFIREGATQTFTTTDDMPDVLASRLLSLRAFDSNHMLVDADAVQGSEAAPVIERLLSRPRVEYVHAHYAKHGCFAAYVTRRYE